MTENATALRAIENPWPNCTTPATLLDYIASEETTSSTKAVTSPSSRITSSSKTGEGDIVLVHKQVESAIAAIQMMDFNDETVEELSSRLFRTIKDFGDKAVNVFAHLIIQDKIPASIAALVLRSLGATEDDTTRPYRLWLEARSLFSDSVRIRDGAVIGLSLMESPGALPYLKKASVSERNAMLRRDMIRLIAHLEQKSNAIVSKED